MISHHPHDELLLARANGHLESGPALLVGVHLEACATCRQRLRLLEGVGGALLEAVEPALMAPEALARTLARIDGLPAATARSIEVADEPLRRPSLPQGVAWPASLRGCRVSRWRWFGPGMRWGRVTLPHHPEAALFLLRIGPGKSLPRHSHTRLELTQVLFGAFDDGRAVFGPGDFDAADERIHHQPVVQPGGECICLASVGGRLVFDGKVAGVIGGWMGM